MFLQSTIFNLQFAISCLYFFLPAYFTNMSAPITKRFGILKCLERPIDFDRTFLGKPILGSHKTWRGMIFGILVGMTIALFQSFLYSFPLIKKISILNYQKINIFYFGFLISFSAIFGDLFFAFIKRRLGLKPGARFLPFDQTNYVISSAFILTPIFKIPLLVWPTLFFFTFFLHLIVNYLGYLLGISKSKW